MLKSLLLMSLFVTSTAFAGEAEIKDSLQKNYPQFGEIRLVAPSPIPGLYEVVTQDRLYYVDDKAQYLIDGSLYDLKNMRNLTEEREHKLFAIDFDKLPLNLALKKVKGNGSRKLVIFTDPNCGFCKRLEHELVQIDNITIYRMLYPVFPGSDEKVRNVWCSKNPNQTWEDMMLNGKLPPAVAKCNTPTEKVLALGQKFRVSGTPSLILSDGTLVPGFLPAAALEKALNEAAAAH